MEVTSAARPALTVGHGTLPAEDLRALLAGAGVGLLVDVRRHPGSRRHPHVARDALADWLPEAQIAYRWEEALGGRRRGVPGSPNTGLRNASFRAYADYMATPEFRTAAARLVAASARQPTAVLCAESLWWRCHRRLLADHLSLVEHVTVRHLAHDGSLTLHTPTDGARPVGDHIVYAEGGTPVLPGLS